jgi:hypothetical protein
MEGLGEQPKAFLNHVPQGIFITFSTRAPLSLNGFLTIYGIPIIKLFARRVFPVRRLEDF